MRRLNGKYSLLSLIYVLTPPLCLMLIGFFAYSRSVDTMAAYISDTLWPVIGAGFLAALIGWAVFLRLPKKTNGGMKAGALTIFLCYFLCAVPLAYAAGNWGGLIEIGKIYFALFVLVQMSTCWITYPIGMLFGHLIAKRML